MRIRTRLNEAFIKQVNYANNLQYSAFLGLIGLLCKTLLSEFVVSVDVLSETAVTVADVIRGNYANQQYLAASNISGHDGTK